MHVQVSSTHGWATDVAAAWLARLSATPTLRMCLPTGLTPLPVYEVVATAGATWGAAAVVLLDEFGGLPAGDPEGCAAVLRRTLVDRVGVAFRTIDAAAPDLDAECAEVDAWLDGGLDLAILGVGTNGHLGMNEPGSDPSARTRRVELAPSTVAATERYFHGRATPTWGVTVGLRDLLTAREVWVLATGAGKADIVARATGGAPTTDVPASLLADHPACTWWVDEAAARPA